MFSVDRIQRLLFAFAFTGFAFFALKHSIAGSQIWLHLLLLMIVFGATIFGLKSSYWILLPITLVSGLNVVSFMGRSIRLAELMVIAGSIIFLANIALLRTPVKPYLSKTWPIYLHFILVATIFSINPVGMAVLGSQAIGGRFYILIVLAFISSIMLANQSVSEKNAKSIIFMGIFLSLFYPLLAFRQMMATETESYYTWHQSLTTPALLILFYLLSKYKYLNVRFVLFYGLTTAIVLFSGKRAVLGLTLILPVFAALLLNRSFSKAIVRFAAIGIILVVFLFSFNHFIQLPRVAQRAFSLIPGGSGGDVTLAAGEDIFRREVRKLAWSEIRSRPVLGRRGYAFNIDEMIYLQFFNLGTADVFGGHAFSANWHSAWLAMWVDFGLLAVFTFGSFLLVTLKYGVYVYKTAKGFQCRQILAGMLVLRLTATIITSYTSGHSALSLFGNWWMLGLLIAIHKGCENDRKKSAHESYQPTDKSTFSHAIDCEND